MKTVVIALLDKAWPPAHSFVDGMLATVAAREPDLQVRLCVSRSTTKGGSAPRRYKRAVCLPLLLPRRGLGRFLNLPIASVLIARMALKEHKRCHRVVLLVRNDPILLIAAVLLKQRVNRVVFQSSFPHEEGGMPLKRWVARSLFRLSISGVDAVTGVSPGGVKRVSKLFPNAQSGPYIPLLSDLPLYRGSSSARGWPSNRHQPVFVYIGSHNEQRRMDVVLAAIVQAVRDGVNARFRFVGAKTTERARLCQTFGVADLVRRGVITIEGRVPRQAVPRLLSESDIGLSLIPPTRHYREASPTKLAEYLGAGLAVLASRGIPLQEQFVVDSHGGLLVDWTVDAIAHGIGYMLSRPAEVEAYRANASRYAEASLQYQTYLPHFRQLIGVPQDHESTCGGA